MRSFAVMPVKIDGITRANVFSPRRRGVQFPMPVPRSTAKQEEMLKLIRGLDDLECLVVSGSLPTGIGPAYYDELIDVVREEGRRVCPDISPTHTCASWWKRGPLLIKPNDEEVAAIFGVDVKSEEDIVSALHTIHDAS